jgi:hypothetical protein
MRPVPVMIRMDIGGDLSGIFSAATAHAIGPRLTVYLTALKCSDTGGCGVIFGGIWAISRKTQEGRVPLPPTPYIYTYIHILPPPHTQLP